MKDFLIQFWPLIIALIVIIYLLASRNYASLRKIAYALMLQAERYFSEGEGKEKFENVFNAMYDKYFPWWFKVVLSKDSLRKLLQSWYNKAKQFLADMR
jgi:hypothetical protein